MIDPSPSLLQHQKAAFWLDVADKLIKFAAVLVGAAWTLMKYKQGRDYANTLELLLTGSIFRKQEIYVQVIATVSNLKESASNHRLQQQGTVCEVLAVKRDLSETLIRVFSVFELYDTIGPGESISDSLQCRLDLPAEDLVWLKIRLRVLSDQHEWNSICLVNIE